MRYPTINVSSLSKSGSPTDFNRIVLIQELSDAKQHVKGPQFAAVQLLNLGQYIPDMAFNITAKQRLDA